MGCGCNTPCGGFKEKKECDCAVKDLGTRCVIYDGEGLEYLNLETNTNTTTVFDFIDDAFVEMKEYVDEMDPSSTLVNYGGGSVELYKGKDTLNRHRISTLESGDNISIVPNGQGGYIVNSTSITEVGLDGDNYITVTGSGDEFNLSFNYANFTSGDVYTVVTSTPTGVTVGVDIDAIRQEVQTEINIESETLSVEEVSGTFSINLLGDGVKRFYVNKLYTGGGNDGSQAKPFLTVQAALDAFVGTGTPLNPQYASQNAEIIVERAGTPYDLPASLLYRNLRIYVKNGATLRTSMNASNYLIDFDSLVGNNNTGIEIRIIGESRTDSRLTIRQPFLRNSFKHSASSNTPETSMRLENINVQIQKAAPYFSTATFMFPAYAHNPQKRMLPLSVNNCNVWNSQAENILIQQGNRGSVQITDSEVRFKTSDGVESDVTNYSCVVSGLGSIDFNNCRIKAFREFTNGVIRIDSQEPYGATRFKNCIFEGDPPTWFSVSSTTTEGFESRVEIANADYYYGADSSIVKLVKTDDSTPTEVFNVYNSYFSCGVGDVDLTRGNIKSTTNYFNDVIREDLVQSETILTTDNSSYEQGLPYLYTPTVADKTTWERRVVV